MDIEKDKLRLLDDYRFFAETCHWIADEQARLVRLELSYSQSIRAKVFMAMYKKGIAMRIIDLKARQVYASTVWTSIAHWLHWKAIGPRRTSIIAPETDKSKNLLRYMMRFEAKLPEEFKKSYPSPNQWYTYAASGAYIEILTARNLMEGRSSNSQTLIMTEPPFYPNPRELIPSLMNSVDLRPETLIVKESTAHGYDYDFYPSWQEATDHAEFLCRKHGAKDQYDLLLNHNVWPTGRYFPIFTPWFDMPKYRTDPESVGLVESKLTKYEKHLMKNHGLDLAQIAWRRLKMNELAKEKMADSAGGDDSDAARLFGQEYPTTPTDAFVLTGSGVFESSTVSAMAQVSANYEKGLILVNKKPASPYRVRLEWERGYSPKFDESGLCMNIDKLRVKAYIDPAGNVMTYRVPKKDFYNRYVIGADASQGLAQGDPSAAFVYDRVDDFFPCFLRDWIDEFTYALELAKLGVWWNGAHILVEENNMGRAVLLRLQQFYRNVMRRVTTHGAEEAPSPHGLGFVTTEKEKPYLIALQRAFHRNNPRSMLFSRYWTECRTFTRDKRGHIGADGKRANPDAKNFDDCVMSVGITLRANELVPLPEKAPLGRQSLKPITLAEGYRC